MINSSKENITLCNYIKDHRECSRWSVANFIGSYNYQLEKISLYMSNHKNVLLWYKFPLPRDSYGIKNISHWSNFLMVCVVKRKIIKRYNFFLHTYTYHNLYLELFQTISKTTKRLKNWWKRCASTIIFQDLLPITILNNRYAE